MWGSGKILDGRDSPSFSYLRLEVVMVFIFGMISGVVKGLLSTFFSCSTRFLVTKRLL